MIFASGCVSAPAEYRDPPPLAATGRTVQDLRVFERIWEFRDFGSSDELPSFFLGKNTPIAGISSSATFA